MRDWAIHAPDTICFAYHSYQGRSTFVFLASGHGGQKIFMVPEFDLVVVVVRQVFNNPMADASNLSIMSQYVLLAAAGPGVGGGPTAGGGPGADAPRPDPDVLRVLAGTYRSGRGGFTIELRQGAL